ncbi:MAG: peptide deformylase, partial [Candidatus Paceibacterales bacterium]
NTYYLARLIDVQERPDSMKAKHILLSYQGAQGADQNIKRSKKIKIKAVDENGNKIKLKVRGFVARVLQHETDHLHGTVIRDRFNEQK